MAPGDAARYSLMTYGELAHRLDVREAPVVALGNWTRGKPWVKQHLDTSGYRLVEQVEGTEIYALPALEAPEPSPVGR